MQIIEKIKSLNLPEGQFVVMGSAILEVKGIRRAGDLDIMVTQELFNKLKKDSFWIYNRQKGSTWGDDMEYLRQSDVQIYPYIYGAPNITYFFDDPTRTEEVEGITFASLSNLLEIKSGAWDRPKDREDARLIKEYLTQNS